MDQNGWERNGLRKGTERNGLEGLDNFVENLPPGRFPGRKRPRFERQELSIPSFILISRGGADRDDESAPRGPKSSFCWNGTERILPKPIFLGAERSGTERVIPGGGGGGKGQEGGGTPRGKPTRRVK